MKRLLNIISGLLMTLFLSITFQVAAGVPAVYSFVALSAGGELVSRFVVNTPGILQAGLYPEAWTGELVKAFRHAGTFLDRIKDYSKYVAENNTIHLVDVGVDPEVLINNNTYPIPVEESPDGDISITLTKFDTKNTAITDDELHGIGYDKIGLKVEQHKDSLEEKTLEKSLHSLCPAANSASTPVLETTGGSTGGTYPRKRLMPADLISLKRKYDDLKIPKKDREIVLCNAHIEDLLMVSETFKEQYVNIAEGTVLRQFGWDISECTYNPRFNAAAKTAFGAAADLANDQDISVAMYRPRAMKALGKKSIKAYLREAKNDPENRRNTLGYRLYHICIPKKNLGFGAIVSAKVA